MHDITITNPDGQATTGTGLLVVTPTANLPPVLSGLDPAISFQENTVNAAAQQIDSNVALTDSDSADFDGGNVTVAYTVGGTAEDQLSVGNIGSITRVGNDVQFSGTTIGTIPASPGAGSGVGGESLIITLDLDSTAANVDALLKALTYRNTSDTPTATRTISLTANDGGGNSNAQTSVITVTVENDPAMITGTTSGTVQEAGGVNNGTPGDATASEDLDFTDVDNTGDVWQATVAATASDNGYGTYELTAAGVWTYTLDDSNAAVQALNDADTLPDSFTVLTEDGTSQVISITINAQNDAADITGTVIGDVTEAGGVNNGTPGDATASEDLDFTDVDNTADVWQARGRNGERQRLRHLRADRGRRVDLHARR